MDISHTTHAELTPKESNQSLVQHAPQLAGLNAAIEAASTVGELDALIESAAIILDDLARSLAEVTSAPDPEPGNATALVRSETVQTLHERAARRRRSLMELAEAHACATTTWQSAIERRAELLDKSVRDRVAAIAQAKTAAETEIRKLQSDLDALSLYLGQSHEFEIVTQGVKAAAGTPFVIMQEVLAMDEETAVADLIAGGDHTSVCGHGFYGDWLRASKENVAQVLPFEKCIVAVIPRRSTRVNFSSTGDLLADVVQGMYDDDLDHRTWFLIRNGDNIAMLTTQFRAASRITPGRDEFSKMFVDSNGDAIEPGSFAWQEAVKTADGYGRYYRQVAMIIAGLLEHDPFLEPWENGEAPSLHNLADWDAGRIRVVNTTDNALTTGRASDPSAWLRNANKAARVGQRVVFTQGLNYYGNKYNRRYHPASESIGPAIGVPYTIKSRDDSWLKVTFKREPQRWHDWDADNAPWGSLSFRDTADFFCCIDNIAPTEIETFLSTRAGRTQYLKLLPLLVAVRDAKRAEKAQEADFRSMLLGKLCEIEGTDPDAVSEALDGLVHWWKTRNTWARPLCSTDPKMESRAIRDIVAEFTARRALATVDTETVAAQLRDQYPDAVYIGRRTRDGKTVIVTPQESIYPTSVFQPDKLWVTMIVGNARVQWKRVTPRFLSDMEIWWVHPDWEHHCFDTSEPPLTDDEITSQIDELMEMSSLMYPEMSPIAVTVAQRGYRTGLHLWVFPDGQATHVQRICHTNGEWVTDWEHRLNAYNDIDGTVLVQYDDGWTRARGIRDMYHKEADALDKHQRECGQKTVMIIREIRRQVDADWKNRQVDKILSDDPTFPRELAVAHVEKITLPASLAKYTDGLYPPLRELVGAGVELSGRTMAELDVLMGEKSPWTLDARIGALKIITPEYR